MSTLTYRPDIDGLRAVAVTLVVLFHAELGISGGFVGVDVFFVISGYLITGLMLRDLATGTFRLNDFWMRRIRRIVPASLLMAIVTLVTGTLLLSPADLEELAESVIAHQFMVSNIFFWKETGYFDGPADLKPLLHTWSLAVEEQFYLMYPALLMGLARYPRKVTIAALAILAAASFALSVWGVHFAPSAAFFLLPSRVWEMLLGGLLWFLPSSEKLHVRWRQLLEIAGLSAVVAAAMCFTSSTPFPGLAASLPCCGAALLIHAGGHRRSVIGRCLASPALVKLGLLSYSLYLWHWPIMVFLRYRLGKDFSLDGRLFTVAASLVVAYLSWRFVELPFRHGTIWRDRRTVLVTSACAMSMLFAVGWFIQDRDGLPERFSPELQRIYATMQAPRYQKFVPITDVMRERLPEIGDASGSVRCLIWGDSHAMALIPVLDESCRDLGIRGFFATYGATLPLIDFPASREDDAPEDYDEAVLDLILADRFDVVILAGYWSRDSDNPSFLPTLRATVEQLTSAGVRVVIIRDAPIQQDSEGSLIAAPLRRGGDLNDIGVSLEEHRWRQKSADSAFAELTGSHVTVVDPTPFLVDAAGRCRIVMDGACLYSDEDHLSLAGARRLKPLFTKSLAAIQSSLVSSVTRNPASNR